MTTTLQNAYVSELNASPSGSPNNTFVSFVDENGNSLGDHLFANADLATKIFMPILSLSLANLIGPITVLLDDSGYITSLIARSPTVQQK
ncbi:MULTISPECIES: hypothetical protein [Burkholderia]|uniref:hypothetical protein n=1 Tax=Burkholderia TaxID=32008 RepID=UPI00158BA59D|nr:hypothetical protein [Burkholderia ambifaria]